jgi:histidyl-tRNA synthetase
MANLITPRTLSGFRDYLPDVMLAREEVLRRAREVYRSYGFTPIDTPACEALDVLLGKGGDESDKLVYRVRSAKSEKEEMGLRFDLTVPFARFSAQYINQLGTPFKRYAMGPVWRGERPGQGRYREFWQCDFDTIGTRSNAADIETALVINDLFTSLGFEKFEVRINNRMVLNGMLTLNGLGFEATNILRAVDKLPKVGRETVKQELIGNRRSKPDDTTQGNIAEQGEGVGLSPEQADMVLDFVSLQGPTSEVLQTVRERYGANDFVTWGVKDLWQLFEVARLAGIPEGRFKLDLSICRGLDYYTGTIYETFLTDLPGIGSVCSGGRYDNLASLYTKQVLPGVGASLGVDRLIAAMEELKHPLLTGQTTPAQVLVVNFDAARLGEYQRAARALRAAGVNVEVYPDAKKVGQQLGYAEKRGFALAVIAGEQEFAAGVWKVKNLAKREEVTVPDAELVARVRSEVNPRE